MYLQLQENMWRAEPNSNHPLISNKCTIARVQTLDATDFEAVYKGTLPVIVANGAADWPALSRWTPEHLNASFGPARFAYGGSLALTQKGAGRVDKETDGAYTMNFSDFLAVSRLHAATVATGKESGAYPNDETPYIFDKNVLAASAAMLGGQSRWDPSPFCESSTPSESCHAVQHSNVVLFPTWCR